MIRCRALGNKLLIWCTAANQLFIHAICQVLQIDSIYYSSDTNVEDRAKMVASFTSKRHGEAMVFVYGYSIGSCGLNLHSHCHYVLEFDAAPNKGIQDEATGRLRRVGQPKTAQGLILL